MNTLLYVVPLVGAHFRPPAKQVISVLKPGTELLLVKEPDNAYDAKAIKVLVDLREVISDRYDELEVALQGTGSTVEELLAIGDDFEYQLLHLGYIADSDGKQLGKYRLPGNREVGKIMDQDIPIGAYLAFDAEGKPQVRVEQLVAESVVEVEEEFEEESEVSQESLDELNEFDS